MKDLEFLYAINGIDDEFITEAADDEKLKEAFCSEWGEEDESEQTESDTAEEDEAKKEKVKRICRKSAKRLLLVAVISALVLATGIAVCGKKISSFDVIKGFGDKLDEMFVGEKVNSEGFEIVKKGVDQTYGTINDFFVKTDFDILYPDKLPDGIVIEKVNVSNYVDNNLNLIEEYKHIIFITNKIGEYQISVATLSEEDSYEGSIYKKIGEFDCHMGIDENIVTCDFIYNNNSYYIHAPTYEDVVTIVSGMKKYDE
ncbi:MAG: hypothetical protein IJC79_04075 [Clostridia bacterium]|nr:hypothetical protein [Clostridia bacterium]